VPAEFSVRPPLRASSRLRELPVRAPGDSRAFALLTASGVEGHVMGNIDPVVIDLTGTDIHAEGARIRALDGFHQCEISPEFR